MTIKNPLINVNEIMDFSKVKAENIKEAVEYYIEKSKEVSEIIFSIENPTWDNVYRDYEENDINFSRVMSLIHQVKNVKGSKEIDDVYEEILPSLVKYSSESSQDMRLIELYNKLSKLELNETQKIILNKGYKSFKDSGANLSKEEQELYNSYSLEISKLSNQYGNNIKNTISTWFLHINEESELDGVPKDLLNILKENAKEKNVKGFVIKLQQPYLQNIIKDLNNRELRKTLQTAYSQIASEFLLEGRYDNTLLIKEIVSLKNKKAILVGYENYVEQSLSNKMANSIEEVNDLLYSLKDKVFDKGKSDFENLKLFALEKDGITDFSKWDYAYYMKRYKESKLNLDSEKVKEFFPVTKVKEGLFWLIEELYDVEIKKEDVDNLYEKEVEYFSLYKDGVKISSVLIDLFAREGKKSGAWMSSYQGRFNAKEVNNIPVAFVNCNFPLPTLEKDSLLSFSEVETLFHEFGHALHHMLTSVNEPAVAGISGVVWDVVELPSQLMEYFCTEKVVLEKISGHFKTGEPLTDELLNKIKESKNFMTSLDVLTQLEYSVSDLKIYNSPEEDAYKILNQVRAEFSVFEIDLNNRFLNNFQHIFSGGYAAGYYSYKWADILSADVYDSFKENGVICKKTAKRFLTCILSQGGSRDINEMFFEFKGRSPSPDAFVNNL